MKYICVFCGTSDEGAEKYAEISREMGRRIVANGYGLICGGANAGLMNIISNAVLAEQNGTVIGITTTEIRQANVVHPRLDQLHEEQTLAARKDKMIALSEGFIVLPGGLGTLDEIMAVAITNQFANFNGQRVKPLALLNVDGFYDGVLMQLDRSCREKFMTREHRDMIFSHDDPDTIINYIINYQSPAQNKERWWETSPAVSA